MAAFQLDHNVSAQLGVFLRAGGHDVYDAREQGLDRVSDDRLLLEAMRAGRLLVTHNEDDFLLLHGAWRRWPVAWGISPAPAHAGILLLPQAPRATPAELARAIDLLLATGARLENDLWLWRPVRGWSLMSVAP